MKVSLPCIVTLIFILIAPYQGHNRNGEDSRFLPLDSPTVACVILLDRHQPEYSRMDAGFNYELLQRFIRTYRSSANIFVAKDSIDYFEALRNGEVDLLVCNATDSVNKEGTESTYTLENGVCWIMPSGHNSRQMLEWVNYMSKTTSQYKELKTRFYGGFNPRHLVDIGASLSTLSPYDNLIKKHSATLGWDWRMLAALIYKESFFSINAISPRGARGLMQMTPSTAGIYEDTGLLDPEKSIAAGVRFLEMLQRYFYDTDISQSERIRFTLASYNAGLGRIEDCRNLAYMLGYDHNTWKGTIEAIPFMRDKDELDEETVKLGVFQGFETIDYVESVERLYGQFCEICR